MFFFFFLVGLEHGQHSTDKSTSPKLLLGEKHKHSSSGRISGTFTVGSVKVRKLEITFVAVWLLNMLPCGAFPCFWLSAIIQPWTTGSSCEPADCQGERDQWCKLLLDTVHDSTAIFQKRNPWMKDCIFHSQGLKKLGQSIESSYSSIQKLVISHLQRYSTFWLLHTAG